MPTYDYRCKSCGFEFEEFQSMSAEMLIICPKCAEPSLKRLMSAGAGLVFKGSGFYLTDYKNANSSPAASNSSNSKSESNSESKTETKSELKSETKSESQSESKSETKSESQSKSEAKTDSKSESKSESKSYSKPSKDSSSGTDKK